jgi:hypothetical protein
MSFPKAAFAYTYRKKASKAEYVSALATKEYVEERVNRMTEAGSYEITGVFQLVPVETEIDYKRVQVTKIKEK